MIDNLLLLSGNDIPFYGAGLSIHQPTLKEIAYLGEENFFTGYEFLNISKNILSEQDKINLEEQTDFDILIAILGEHNAVMLKNRNCVEMVLALLFPEYQILFENKKIILKKNEEIHTLDNNNFIEFKQIFNSIFPIREDNKEKNYNPSGELAKKIASKLVSGRQKAAAAKNKDSQKVDVISRYLSILTVGQKKDMNDYFKYTLYQLFDEHKRYVLKSGYDMYIKAKLAGAQDLKEVEDWMQDIHL
jgi:hypothetical protein